MRILFTVLALMTLSAAFLPRHTTAQTLNSLKITYTVYTHAADNGTCHIRPIGSHPDPIGNGRDSDYSYPCDTGSTFSDCRYSRDTPGWANRPDVPGQEITFLASINWSGSCENDSYPENISQANAHWENYEAYAFFAAPPNEPPTARFSWSQSETEMLTIDFDASGSSDPDGEVVSYDWDFGGDGASGGGGQQTTFTYTERGAYEVTLTVRDDDGDEDETSTSVDVEGPDLRYAVTVGRYAAESAQDGGLSLQVGDTVQVAIAVENTGDLPLEAIHLPGAEATIAPPSPRRR